MIELGLVLLSIPLALFSPYFGSSWFCIAGTNLLHSLGIGGCRF